MQHMQTAGKRARGGQNVRLIEVPADAGKDRGIFEDVHGFTDPAAFAVHLTRAAKGYFGKPIRGFLREVCNSVDDVREIVRSAQASFVKAAVHENSSGEVHRAGRRFGLVAGAGELATTFDLTGWKPGEAIRASTDCFNAWLADRGGIAGYDEISAVSHVRSLLAASLTSRFQRGRDERVMNQLGYVETQDDGVTEYRLLPEIFRNEICRGFDHEAVANALIKRRFMVSEDGHSTVKRILPGIGRKRVYVVLSTIFEE
jgi:putative DNA primase/helicase